MNAYPARFKPNASSAAIGAALLSEIPARVGIFDNPLQVEISADDFTPVRGLATIASLAPKTNQAFVCLIDGVYIPRADWGSLVRPGETIAFEILPHGGGKGGSNPLRVVLQLALMVGVAWFVGPAVLGLTGMAASAASAGLMILGSLLINALVPLPKATDGNSATASPTYSIALQGNSARLDQPKVVAYGLNRSYPDYATQPYQHFENNEQYFSAVLQVGMGRYDIHKIEIDDTPISNFQDISVQVVGPDNGSLSTQALVDLSMISSPEVSGQELRDHNVWTGGFTACRSGYKIKEIILDFVMPRGIGNAKEDSTGELDVRVVEVQAQVQEIDDFGAPVGDWIDIRNSANQNYSFVGNTLTAQQRSFSYVSPDFKRYQVRAKRVTPYVDSSRDLCELTWVGMRSKLTISGINEPVNPQGTYILLKLRASKQLSGMSQRKIAVTAERKIPKFDGTSWIWIKDSSHHRNPAWAICDMLRNPFYSLGLPDSRIDMDAILALAQSCEERQDRFDYLFDTKTTIFDALALATRCARAVNIVRRGNYSFVRDSAQTLPVVMFQPRNMAKDSLTISNAMPQEGTPDAVRMKYRDGRFWDERVVIGQYWKGNVYAYLEGQRPATVPVPAKYAEISFPGISGFNHALREVAYIVATSRWRRATYTWTTDREGMIPAYGSLVGMAHDLIDFPQSAETLAYEGVSRTLVASQPMTWTAGAQHYIRISSKTGAQSIPLAVSRGNTDEEMILAAPPPFTIVGEDSDYEPTRLAFGDSVNVCEMLRLKSIKPKGQLIEMVGIVESDRVHAADNAFLPVGGAPQDLYNFGNLQPAVMPAAGALM
ncbi:MAG: host specificity factor TipJ family phage tail protein [bacterium]|nr:host specificity factor TipJ family phage tail protein [bacterium]